MYEDSYEYIQLVKLHTLLQDKDASLKDIFTFLKKNMNIFTNIDFRKHILKESFMLLMILDESDGSNEDIHLILDVITILLKT